MKPAKLVAVPSGLPQPGGWAEQAPLSLGSVERGVVVVGVVVVGEVLVGGAVVGGRVVAGAVVVGEILVTTGGGEMTLTLLVIVPVVTARGTAIAAATRTAVAPYTSRRHRSSS